MPTGFIGRNENRKRKRDRNRAKGLCLWCSKKAKKDRVLCSKHLKFASERQRSWQLGVTNKMKKILQKKAEKLINRKCSECEERAVALFERVAFCSKHARMRKW